MSNEAARKARGERARNELEFLGPILADMKAEYVKRIADLAANELDPKVRTHKITSLSVGLRVVNNIELGLDAVINDGKLADQALLKADRAERMGKDQRRLLNIAAY